MVDLSGLAGFGAGFGNALPGAQEQWARARLEQQKVQDYQRRLQLARLASSAYGDQGLGGLPGAQPLPGAAAPPQGGPAPQATPAQLALRPGPQGLIPAQGAPPLQGPMPGPQAGAGPQMPMPGMASIEQIAARIKAKNPGISGEDLFDAVGLAAQQMNPESRLLYQLLASQYRIEGRHEDVAAQQAGATGRTAMQQAGAGARTAAQQAGATTRTGMTQAGADTRQATRLSTVSAQTQYVQGQINKRLQQAGGTKAAKDMAKAHLDGLKAERQGILDQARETGGVTTPEQTQQLNDINKKIADFQRTNEKLLGAGAATVPAPSGGGTLRYDNQGNRVDRGG